jgi:hypothetical protein
LEAGVALAVVVEFKLIIDGNVGCQEAAFVVGLGVFEIFLHLIGPLENSEMDQIFHESEREVTR